MNRSQQQSRLDPAIVGTLCCIASALGYTAANICLRKLAELKADEMWTICIKEVVTVAAVGPWLLRRKLQGARLVPSKRALLALVLTGLAVQLVGNLSLQWAFGVIGIAIAVPVLYAVMLSASAAMGLIALGERVPGRSVAAIVLLIGSIALLSAGAARAGETVEAFLAQQGFLQRLLGVGAACLCGGMFATLSTVIRSSVTTRVPVTTIVVIITGMGVLSLGSLSIWRLGIDTLLHTNIEQLAWMLAAGTFNLLAFLAITHGLRFTSLVRANLLNGSQVAMAAVAGMLLFHETLDAWATLGVTLTIAGVLLIGQPKAESREPTMG